jgi:hypothetical protein
LERAASYRLTAARLALARRHIRGTDRHEAAG